MNPRMVDLAVFISANLFNVLAAAMFLSRKGARPGLDRAIGVPMLLTGIPMIAAVVLNALQARAIWLVVLPIPLIVHDLMELGLDYIFKLEFRRTALLGPYLLVFYLGQMGGIGYAFLIGRAFGFFTLGTYVLSLVATAVSEARPLRGRA